MTPKEAIVVVKQIVEQKANIAKGVKDPKQKALLERQAKALRVVSAGALSYWREK